MQIARSVTDLIGHTPLLELCRYEKAHNLPAVILQSWSGRTLPAAPRTGWPPI